jgi:hypothetical protein
MSSWGLYPWFRESGPDLIHPDDLPVVLAHSPYGMVCECVRTEGPYLVLHFGPFEFRAKPDHFDPVPPPPFQVGQEVKTIAPRTPRTGKIRVIRWHFKRSEHLFFIEADGKALSNRYWASQLTLQ